MPPGSPDGLRDRLEVLMIHPLANSGGARHLPSLVAEDVLVEDFPDPAGGEQSPASPLLATLELPGRRGLTRVAIEQALLVHGARWGRKPFWTHFDGHLIRTVEGRIRLQALAGGDVRYGSLYDLLGVGRDDDSDRLVARFAVVHRERMVVW